MSHTQTMPTTSPLAGFSTESGRLTALPAGSAAGAIHDLANLMQITSSAVNVVARNPSIHSTNLEPVIAGAMTSLERAGDLVRQTISIVHERATSVEQVGLANFFNQIEELFQVARARNVRLDMQANADLPLVECDPLALQNAVLNLLFNARDAMPDGGVIAIRAQAIAMGPREGVELRVADSGIGMKPNTIARAFDPFFTTKSNGLGGFGLPTVERFVEEVGGRILIESEFGVGTTVRLQLPASPQPAQ